jgi:hypothetical protein
MSQKLTLVKFELEDDVPVDETSKIIMSTYVPDEFVDLLFERKISTETEIKESIGSSPDIPVIFINEIEEAIHEVGVKLTECIRTAYEQVCGDLLIEKEVDSSYRDLLIWLKIRELLILKQEKHIEDSQFRLVVG